MKTTNVYKPFPGYCLILPDEKDTKSTYIAVQDSVDKSYKGEVIAVGEPFITDFGIMKPRPVSPGDRVLYSIAGCEETKLLWKGNERQRFIIVPFGRLLLKL